MSNFYIPDGKDILILIMIALGFGAAVGFLLTWWVMG